MFGISKYLALAAGLIILILIGALAYLKSDNDNLRTALARSEVAREVDRKTAEAALEEQRKTIDKVKDRLRESQVEVSTITYRYNDIAAANERLRKNVDKWRSALDDETIKRPAVVARAARIAIRRSMRRAECITDPDCPIGPDGNPLPDPAPAAQGDSAADTATDSDEPGDREGKSGEGGSRGRTAVRADVLHEPGQADLLSVGRGSSSGAREIPSAGRQLRSTVQEGAR